MNETYGSEAMAVRRDDRVVYGRDSAFSYTCRACCRCCHDKVIRLNPYEVARLAMNRGMTTTEFLSGYTESNGTSLRRGEEGACVFLTPQGCAVHPDRPLVCRLYPLGRRVTAEGEERFHELIPHPRTEGEYGTSGTVDAFLSRQGAQPFIEAVDRYIELIRRMAAALIAKAGGDGGSQGEVRDAVREAASGDGKEIPDWLDMDQVVNRYCEQNGLTAPTEVVQKMTLHIQAIEAWLEAV